MSRIEKEIKKIREDLKEIKSDLKTFLTDETSKDYVKALINNVKGKAKDSPLSIEMWKGHKGNLAVGDFLDNKKHSGKPSNETDEQLYLEHWTCDICGKHTHKVEYDYLGNGTNHLDCELKHEIAAMEAGVDVNASKESN